MIRFIEVINRTDFNPRLERTSTPNFTLGEIWINEDYVVSVREALGHKTLLREGLLPDDLADDHAFTTITTNNGNITETHVVVGSPNVVASRLSNDNKILLKG
tara:strand:- start:161 stop:469 length:309 start_codon:yes stop_codon:yes gene_type:complete